MSWSVRAVLVLAYFTEPMGDEFKKAMEQAMKELEEQTEGDKPTGRKKRTNQKKKHLSQKTRQSLK
jgi:hypothetical protein